ncbi:hypothetical protein LTR62_004656 [Meristemomyces frigidus]|uniref:Membrane-associated protein n=1 Tax=Meristemomyces frigidus TaxID=1508187 RepID=A0AAN7YJV0_9PEZI|nr:hypothetical protein LTR62_004656 [Meristemomyces frigidus]
MQKNKATTPCPFRRAAKTTTRLVIIATTALLLSSAVAQRNSSPLAATSYNDNEVSLSHNWSRFIYEFSTTILIILAVSLSMLGFGVWCPIAVCISLVQGCSRVQAALVVGVVHATTTALSTTTGNLTRPRQADETLAPGSCFYPDCQDGDVHSAGSRFRNWVEYSGVMILMVMVVGYVLMGMLGEFFASITREAAATLEREHVDSMAEQIVVEKRGVSTQETFAGLKGNTSKGEEGDGGGSCSAASSISVHLPNDHDWHNHFANLDASRRRAVHGGKATDFNGVEMNLPVTDIDENWEWMRQGNRTSGAATHI